ncbi:DEAD/DEAH box helicase family protein [Limihaloglobus sulfuriphilus]|uniref:DEAD/DEAH box helicase family protein n=1 Tax=Limihaloglobus sulfuriphilus TaxID=1851148 RepID=UPI001649A679|nr:DEAD/DEAH box helicase family protein [Limihaloglobus sulfuriphilus]
MKLEKENNQSLINNTLRHIGEAGRLRPPQREAIETYLWIKFAGNNKRLSDMVREGILYDDVTAQEYDYYYTFKGNYVTQFLNQFFQDNKLKALNKKLVNDPEGIYWDNLLDELLHNFDYSNYLFSLPMGAGKTYLMACFIYLDLYFASLFKNDRRFAHNFVVFAPQASKTAILPSLRTIKEFNPEWILPKEEADKLKQVITIEILDSLSSKRKDKLHGNNPNLEKVNRIKQSKDFGTVFITNAEKVVLERYDEEDQIYVDPKNMYYDEKKASELKKTNELREALSQVPNLTVILDEVHHSYGSTGNGEKKLRQAVGVLNQHGNVNSVIGLSGTPYVKTKIEIEGKNITLNQIQDIVYNYPLNIGIGKFLKKPDIRKVSVKESRFIEQALTDFFSDYDVEYENGTKSKAAFYCPSIKKLNEDILPIVQNWYQKHRKGREDEIFRYYSGVDKKNKQYQLPKENLAIFNNLDKPYSKKRIILLVAVGTEGWDCRSLTSVVLPRQKTTKNFVLQTTCRCLREVTDASNENALIYLSSDNYETLDKELRANYQLSITDLSEKKEQSIDVQVRKPKLGRLKYKQIETKYRIVKKSSPEIKKELVAFRFAGIKKSFDYDKSILSGRIGTSGLTGEVAVADVRAEATALFSFDDFMYNLSLCTYGLFSQKDLLEDYADTLRAIHDSIEKEMEWLILNPNLDISGINRMIASSFMDRVEYTKEVIEQETEIELLEWQGSNKEISLVSPDGKVYKIMPRIPERDLLGKRGYANDPKNIEEDFFGDENNCDPQDISYNYVPYKMDSEFEQNALAEMLKLSELKDLEVYFNGYKDERLQSFWIQTPRGRYTPDFLILRRKENRKYKKGQTIPIEKALIIETKGEPYYNDEFKAKEKFVEQEFLKYNKHFKYHCFVDKGKNDFTRHLDTFKKLLEDF